MQDLIGYDEIIENSMRSVIYETLKRVEKTGLPGGHYFIVTFLTKFKGIKMKKTLKINPIQIILQLLDISKFC